MLSGSIADSKLSTITESNKVEGSAVQLSSTSAIENSSGLRIKTDLIGTGLSLSNQVLSVDATQSQLTTIGQTGNTVNFPGNIAVPSGGYVNLADQPTNANYAVNKSYVDSIAEGLHILSPCLVASVANYSSTYDHNTTGSGATLTINLGFQVKTHQMGHHPVVL